MTTATLGEVIARLNELAVTHGAQASVLWFDDDTDWLLNVEAVDIVYDDERQAVILRSKGYFDDN
jgi:hypothetical protein